MSLSLSSSQENTSKKRQREIILSCDLQTNDNDDMSEVNKTTSPLSTTSSTCWMRQFKNQNHSLRISVSDVAACTGFHPFKNLPDLVMKLVYQGQNGNKLLQHDANLLQLEIVSEEEQIKQMTNKLQSKAAKQILSKILNVKAGKQKLSNVESAKTLDQAFAQQIQKQQHLLSMSERRLLQQSTRQMINTGFGTMWEETALNLYEQQYGTDVYQRNEDIVSWPFMKNGMTLQPLEPLFSTRHAKPETTTAAPATAIGNDATVSNLRIQNEKTTKDDSTKVLESNSIQTAQMTQQDLVTTKPKQSSVIDLFDNGDDDSEHDNNNSSSFPLVRENNIMIQNLQLPYCILRGSVDGIRDEITISENDEWELHPIIIECKHRMKQPRNPPPLYEQIQAVAYCFMYKVEHADIIQVLRKRKVKTGTSEKKYEKNLVAATNTTNLHHKPTNDATPKAIEELSNDNGLAHHGNDIAPVAASNPIQSNADKTTTKPFYVYGTKNIIMSNNNNNNNNDNSKNASMESTFKIIKTNKESSNMEFLLETNSNDQKVNTNIDNNTKQTLLPKDEEATTNPTTIEIIVNRVTINDPIFQHEDNWQNIVLPRLYTFTKAIYTIRQDDIKRYQLLHSIAAHPQFPLDAWNLLFEECPWLIDCDTSFIRQQQQEQEEQQQQQQQQKDQDQDKVSTDKN